MQDFFGNRLSIQIFSGSDTKYLDKFNNKTLKIISNMSLVGSPIDGGTEISSATITGSKLKNNTILRNKLNAALSLGTLDNDTYLLGQNEDGDANLDLIKVNISDLLEHGIYWNGLRLDNTKIIGGQTAAAADHDMMKINSSDQWEFLNTARSQHIYPKETSAYDLGSTSLRYNNIHTDNISFKGRDQTIDRYEEGTFTPTVEGEDDPGSRTYVRQEGRYTRIGVICFYRYLIEWTGGSGSGDILLKDFIYQDKWPESAEPGNLVAGNQAAAGRLLYLGPNIELRSNDADADSFISEGMGADGLIVGSFWIAPISD